MTLLTEEEARKKRCPMPMGVMHDQRTQNHCIASDCMAWRWVDAEPPHVTIFEAGESDADFAARRDRILSKRKGFCGAFGWPA